MVAREISERWIGFEATVNAAEAPGRGERPDANRPG